MRYSWALCLAAALSLAAGQVPGFGGCPVYQPMTNFDLSKYMGTWYEAERMFAVTEAGARCVSATYTKFPDGKVRVANQITNRLTGLTRQLDGEINMIGKAGEAKLSVKYSSLPVSIDSEYIVLDTDYDTYSIVWSCSSLGPIVNRQNAWIMTRERLPPSPVLQRVYGILDDYKMRRTFFVKTDQENCDYVAAPGASGDAPPAATTAAAAPAATAAPAAAAKPGPAAAPAAAPAASSRRFVRETAALDKEEASAGHKKPLVDVAREKRPATKPDKEQDKDKAPNKKAPSGAA
ncbi:apolipoprotein D-like [Schistocerca cancellata]|uniref:apolipoprotein D-like n=1 Tax=Schistocerca cancellata TaxID=274614 RepID=UPI002117E2E2|nr:apolipoprotein D-like [Schistocerca cancellata]